jgi:lipid-A-disaccharide synthase
MISQRIMVIAGEPSGDALAAEFVKALRARMPKAEFFGAGGNKMAEAGVKVSVDMTEHSVIGLGDVLRKYAKFRAIFDQLLQLAAEQKPTLIVLVDFSGFNRRFAHAVRKHLRDNPLTDWTPKIVQYVSPQVWASRPSRAEKMAKDVDLLLCILPFEKDWYARRVPDFCVEFVGHPIFDRHAGFGSKARSDDASPAKLLLLPGSRPGEVKRHLPVMLEAAERISSHHSVSVEMVLPTQSLVSLAKSLMPKPDAAAIQVGNLAQALSEATVAIASTGTVLLECAYFGVPTVAMYRTSWGTYQIGKRIVQVKYLSMPNILADEEIYPEFIQHNATAENIATAALAFLNNTERRQALRARLASIIASLGGPGAGERSANAALKLMGWRAETPNTSL